MNSSVSIERRTGVRESGGSGLAHLSSLDEARFGIRVARAAGFTADTLPSILAFCHDHDVALLIARSSSIDLPAMRAARAAGLELMDTQVSWVIDIKDIPVQRPESEAVRPLRPGEAEQVREVAREAFHGYLGHYHADPRLSEAACDELYADWAYRSCVAPDDAMNVATVDGEIAGFASVRMRSKEDGEGVIGGVSPRFRGRGLFAPLHMGRVLWCQSQGASRMFSATLAGNVRTQRAYVKCGLRQDRVYYTFHKWFIR